METKNMTGKRFPLGIQTFSEMITGNYMYVDKTELLYELVHYAKFQFLSRPRRFGKSLFVSTLQAYFEGRKDLFKGLAIEGLEKEWNTYPVIHLDMSTSKYFRLKNLHSALNNILSKYERAYHIELDKDDADVYSVRLTNIILSACQQTGQKVVVLIDEYDAPMHDSMKNEKLQEEIREVMRDLFSPLKFQEANLRFVFITGISKFSQLSIFSELNNLKILTMKDEFSSVCGFSEEELKDNFREYISDLAQENGMSYAQAIEELRIHYDGYHFSAKSQGIYNPYSIINALDDKTFNNYWFSSATPTFLIELLQEKGFDMLDLDEIWASESRFNVPTEKLSDPIPVLYQSGYLTIKEYDADRMQYRLSFPNEEVRKGFSESLYRYYAPDEFGRYDALVAAYNETCLKNDDIEQFLPHLKTFYDKFPYTLVNNNERHYQAVMYTIFAMLGAEVSPEFMTSDGRIDLLVKSKKSIYIFELKCDKDSVNALKQIRDKKYANAFADDGRRIYVIGINFSKDQRTIDDWRVSEYERNIGK